MKGFSAIAGLLAVLLLGVGIYAGSSGGAEVDRPVSQPGVQQTEMLESDMAMLDQMRAATSPMMLTMIGEDPMWTDPDMIRAQEEYQAQMDRMLGERPGQP